MPFAGMADLSIFHSQPGTDRQCPAGWEASEEGYRDSKPEPDLGRRARAWTYLEFRGRQAWKQRPGTRQGLKEPMKESAKEPMAWTRPGQADRLWEGRAARTAY